MSTFTMEQVEATLEGSDHLNEVRRKIKKFIGILERAIKEVTTEDSIGDTIRFDLGHRAKICYSVSVGNLAIWIYDNHDHGYSLSQDLPRGLVKLAYSALSQLVNSIEEHTPGVISWLRFFEEVTD